MQLRLQSRIRLNKAKHYSFPFPPVFSFIKWNWYQHPFHRLVLSQLVHVMCLAKWLIIMFYSSILHPNSYLLSFPCPYFCSYLCQMPLLLCFQNILPSFLSAHQQLSSIEPKRQTHHLAGLLLRRMIKVLFYYLLRFPPAANPWDTFVAISMHTSIIAISSVHFWEAGSKSSNQPFPSQSHKTHSSFHSLCLPLLSLIISFWLLLLTYPCHWTS